PLDVLSKLGGFDIAGLCGVCLGGALEGLPVLMDGFISGVAALPMLAEYCLPLVKVGGSFLAMKGASGEEELAAARGAIRK
ncbi:nicotinate-nucleotide--dimethylbenzimidazole phosphoribosyltransferase, partial [Faecalibacterium duncaniae]|uniref:nicotinate-nucleotide--dimethylbenzimidazole phosphoribosyltransferase n=1 Tax=Faecalibacterium duncaniae (strain DSM 17677 / JCM 31915 / A2-165) TaxID=411483 RepID=UPI00293FF994